MKNILGNKTLILSATLAFGLSATTGYAFQATDLTTGYENGSSIVKMEDKAKNATCGADMDKKIKDKDAVCSADMDKKDKMKDKSCGAARCGANK